ncbi:MAG: ADP-ribosylglycohydrolase family protein [Anaerolineae bacterium]
MTLEQPLDRARVVLEGLSVGDALGERFGFHQPDITHFIPTRTLPAPPWKYSDDTNMALSIYENLRLYGEINQDALVESLVTHYDDNLDYNMTVTLVVNRVRRGEDWRAAAQALFDNEGSFGNSSAMRVGPIGAYFYDDLEQVKAQARLSAEPTNHHYEGIAGAVAVAVAVAVAWSMRSQRLNRQDFLTEVMEHTPPGAVRAGLRRARDLPTGTSMQDSVHILGNGGRITAHDSVPFALWSAAKNIGNYEEALWQTIRAGGDADTTCAIVGAVVAAYAGANNIPAQWIKHRQPLPEWAIG